MKTPEQIADAIIFDSGNKPEAWTLATGRATLYGLPPAHGRKIRDALILAIEADRAQRGGPVIVTEDAGGITTRTRALNPVDAHDIVRDLFNAGYLSYEMRWEVE